ncbi:MAG TPA: T9SS type A sorting domain-containing protein [Chitinophagaceae bacterium]|nr:T9SS type A sorting domain-containing protein [Chitinophagaceae bacterium]
MKTYVPFLKLFKHFSFSIVSVLLFLTTSAQTFTTISNGSWNSASTWQGGNIPNASNIPLTAIVNIKHIVTYSGGNINNNGFINISNPGSVTPRLIVASGVNINNNLTGKINIANAELRQYRFAGGGESGTTQSGSFKNTGGYVEIKNSFVEIAQDWENQLGTVVLRNSSLVLGRNYDLKTGAIDTLDRSSVSLGMHGSGDYTVNGLNTYYKSFRIEIASTGGKFNINGGIANGSIDYIMLKNHVTNVYSNDKIQVSNGVIVTGGLSLNAYCIGNPSNYQVNGKLTGPQTQDCSLNYFPAGLTWSSTETSLNLSTNPVLIAGNDKQVGAQYKYEGVAPGIDAIVKIDSLKGGASIATIDDNSGSGFREGFQPQIKSGSIVGQSYGVFTVSYRITGTATPHTLNSFSLTGLDIDGSSALKEFDEIGLGTGATASYIMSNPSILLTEVSPGTFRGINIDGKSVGGIDTSAKQYMFSVTNSNVSAFTIKIGMQTTQPSSETRLYSIYMKGFMYPQISTLPVKMESFTAVLSNDGNKVMLNWKTLSELNVSHFVVERSINGTDYKDIGVVFAAGNSMEQQAYSFDDNVINASDAILYYRLRTVDIDEKYMYSQIRLIKLSNNNPNIVSIITYPNPVRNDLQITIPASWQNRKVIYELFRADGQSIRRIERANSSQTETVTVSGLASGFYILRVSCELETSSRKIIKQ